MVFNPANLRGGNDRGSGKGMLPWVWPPVYPPEPGTMKTLPADHDVRMMRARLALDGLSIGDAFGASICSPDQPNCLRRPRPLPQRPWFYTDDTEMAMGIVEVL